MPDLREQLAPFNGKLCTFHVPENRRGKLAALQLLADGADSLKLYIFDWKPFDDDLKNDLREAAGQDDYRIFAVVNPTVTTGDIRAIAFAENQGFLMYTAEGQDRIYVSGAGIDFEQFTKDVAGFVAGLSA
jgi:hypothetical protein